MYESDRVYLSKFSQTDDNDPYFEEDYFQDLELDGEFNQLLDVTDLDGTDDYFFEYN